MHRLQSYALLYTSSLFVLSSPIAAYPSPNENDHQCFEYQPATVTVTVTEAPKAEAFASSPPDPYTYSSPINDLSPSLAGSSGWSGPGAPILANHGWSSCFDRNYHVFTYSYDQGFHFSGQSGALGHSPWTRSTSLGLFTAMHPSSVASPSTISPSNHADTVSTILHPSSVMYHNTSTTASLTSATNSITSKVTTTSTIETSTTTSTIKTSTTTSTSTSTSTSTTTSSSATCTPTLALDGVAENTFNKKNTPFTVNILGCSSFDVTNTTALVNLVPLTDLSITPDSISFTGLADEYVLLSIFAMDSIGNPLIDSYELHFGAIDMPVRVLGPDGLGAGNVLVSANATIYPGLGQSCVTDASGLCYLTNLPSTTIGLVARIDDNSIAVNGLAATTSQVTLQLMSFEAPSGNVTLDVDDGLSGWTGGAVSQSLRIKRDTTLTVATNGQPDLQIASGSFPVHASSKTAYIRYKFVTAEVPGGYFGTQFNDYYSVTIRSDTGAFVTATNSMNALGLGAFDASGATDWMMLSLQLPANTKSVEFTVGVSNVADSLLDSSVIVDKAGEAECDECGDCEACPTDPMCLDKCKSPVRGSCNFYRDCAEAQLGCGAGGYPLHYGERNCNKFQNNLNLFSGAGQTWIFDTMLCLQQAMVPVLQTCTADCASFSQAAFNSHPGCYVNSGVCGLSCSDVIALMATVKGDLLVDPKQIILTAGGCLENILQTLSGCAGELLVPIIIAYLLA